MTGAVKNVLEDLGFSLKDFGRYYRAKPIYRESTNETSFQINKDTEFRYHTDNGNLENTYSTMLTMKKDIRGGYLHLPEYNAVIENENNSILIFDGAATSHGVTPMQMKNKASGRVTVVWYCLNNLKKGKMVKKYEEN